MVIHNPAKFDVHGHCGSGDMTFVMGKDQDSTCSSFDLPLLSLKHRTCHFHTHKISGVDIIICWFVQ